VGPRVPGSLSGAEPGITVTRAALPSWLGRGGVTVAFAAVVVTLILVVTLDLDRPTRGLIRVPTTPLTDLRASMALPPPAASR